MPRATPPPQQPLMANAKRLRIAAERHRSKAADFDERAESLETAWRDFIRAAS